MIVPGRPELQCSPLAASYEPAETCSQALPLLVTAEPGCTGAGSMCLPGQQPHRQPPCFSHGLKQGHLSEGLPCWLLLVLGRACCMASLACLVVLNSLLSTELQQVGMRCSAATLLEAS